MTPVEESASAPLLPVTAPSASRGTSPNPAKSDPDRSGAPSPSPATRNHPNMWSQEHTHSHSQTRNAARDKDLTNVKLAKNQYVLLEQIESLRQTIDRQGEMLSSLMAVMALKEGVNVEEWTSPSKADKGKSKESTTPLQHVFDFGADDEDEERHRD